MVDTEQEKVVVREWEFCSGEFRDWAVLGSNQVNEAPISAVGMSQSRGESQRRQLGRVAGWVAESDGLVT